MSKPIILEDIENKLEREWKLLGETTITEEDITAAGDTGITSLCVECGDMTSYNELMVIIRIPFVSGLNTVDGRWKIGLSENADTLPSDYHGYLLGIYGTCNFYKDLYNDLVIKTQFMNGSALCSLTIKDNYGGYKASSFGSINHTYTDNPAMARNYYPCKLEGKTTYWLISELYQDVRFKYPAYTVLEVYGR